LTVVEDPGDDEKQPYDGLANSADLPILVAAHRAGCPWLMTFNVRHY